MSDRKISRDVDGIYVDNYAVTFTGLDEIAASQADYMTYDDEVLVVCKARVKMPRLKDNVKGEVTRVNVLKVQDVAVVRSDELKQYLCDALSMEMPQERPATVLDSPNTNPIDAPVEGPPGQEHVVENKLETFPLIRPPSKNETGVEDDEEAIAVTEAELADLSDAEVVGEIAIRKDDALAEFVGAGEVPKTNQKFRLDQQRRGVGDHMLKRFLEGD